MRVSCIGILLLFEPILGRGPYLYNRGIDLRIRSRDGIHFDLNSRIATTLSSTIGGGSGPSSSLSDSNDEEIDTATEVSSDLNASGESDNADRANESDESGEKIATDEQPESLEPDEISHSAEQVVSSPSDESNSAEDISTLLTSESESNAESKPIEKEETPSPDIAPVEDKLSDENSKLSAKEIRRIKKKEERSHRRIAKMLKNRNHLNMSRKVLHAGFGLFFATLNHILPKSKFVPGMVGLTSVCLFMELVRYRKSFGWMNDALHFFLGSSLRKHEMEGKFTGSFYYFLGVTITTALFPPTCASLGIIQLALADPSASYFGRQTRHVYWSRIENGFFGIGRNKGFLGFLGGALFCFPFNYRVLSIAQFGASGIPGGKQSVAIASLALGLAGSFADLCVPTPALTMPKKILGVPMPPLHVDDNVVVPIFSGYACTKIFNKLGWSHSVDLAKYIIF